MIVLAIDTTADTGSVCLLDSQSGELSSHAIEAPDGFGHVLFNEIRRVLDERGLMAFDVDLFAAASGPGSFTGVRVGLACIKGLAEACDKRAIGVSTLQAIASLGTAKLRMPIIDARRGEIYAAVYDSVGSRVVDERVLPFDAWLETLTREHLPASEVELLSPSADLFQPRLESTAFATSRFTATPLAIAPAIAQIAIKLAESGAGDPLLVDANYVRRSDAELFWVDK